MEVRWKWIDDGQLTFLIAHDANSLRSSSFSPAVAIHIGEKFYQYVEWLLFLKDKVIEPAGYKLTGSVDWHGERNEDAGTIDIIDNQITTSSVREPTPKVWKLAETPSMDGQTWDGCFYNPTIQLKREKVDAFYEGQSEDLIRYVDQFKRDVADIENATTFESYMKKYMHDAEELEGVASGSESWI